MALLALYVGLYLLLIVVLSVPIVLLKEVGLLDDALDMAKEWYVALRHYVRRKLRHHYSISPCIFPY